MAFFWYPDSVSNILRTIGGWGVRLYGSSSGAVGLLPAAAAGSTDYTLPGSAPSSNGQALVSTMTGAMSWSGPFAALVGATFTGQIVNSTAGTASTSPLLLSGSIFTGGTATTTFPQVLIQPTGTTAVTSWNTSGTGFGINAASGFSGNLIDFHVNGGSSVFFVRASGIVQCSGQLNIGGNLTLPNTSGLQWSSRALIVSGADGQITCRNNANTADGTVQGSALIPSGLTGATAACRLVGATTTGAPTSGTFSLGDIVFAQDSHIWQCTAAGTPGTWTKIV